ncbi:uncharacterized protein L969DRAFT_94304 [Mixia osmundae IAM 14324]|uniref:non-specific serine/threonine protein kinase n=1 Tax=Mixia osmundae (strain CBS 9802 / IAM 14324 / JCM 22182 / KY 12970) TaxID=764103 RepID=G7E8G6_MIXOS|nr:uncharacterized protein L969DRAFT_94304 [Mixia osmundae IAM 14324]KEI39228.1 hypothetical protein L969DRAFT_94304 [Mixia osmundae IAM 14324]GAA99126.1 hypothetical protein E5Q_05816 [Mixia osmundae IAM 14324]
MGTLYKGHYGHETGVTADARCSASSASSRRAIIDSLRKPSPFARVGQLGSAESPAITITEPAAIASTSRKHGMPISNAKHMPARRISKSKKPLTTISVGRTNNKAIRSFSGSSPERAIIVDDAVRDTQRKSSPKSIHPPRAPRKPSGDDDVIWLPRAPAKIRKSLEPRADGDSKPREPERPPPQLSRGKSPERPIPFAEPRPGPAIVEVLTDSAISRKAFSATYETPVPRKRQPEPCTCRPRSDLRRLLTLCEQEQPYTFDSFVGQFPLVTLCADQVLSWRKIGEASYSEVFTASANAWYSHATSTVVKIIPIVSPSPNANMELAATSQPADIEREIEISYLLEQSHVPGYAKLRGAYVVQGKYPEELMQQWQAYMETGKSLNPSPELFDDEQAYAILCLTHHGKDLELAKLKNWTEAASVMWQVAKSVEAAEEACSFEHRDLHWGNVLISREPPEKTADQDFVASFGRMRVASSSKQSWPTCLDNTETGITATIIDYTLSRATRKSGDFLSGGFEDESVFEGQGDLQFDIYRQMREICQDDWSVYVPFTNLLWLHYLGTKILNEKAPRTLASRTSLGFGFMSRPVFASPGIATAKRASAVDKTAELRAHQFLLDAVSNLSNEIEQTLDRVRSQRKARQGRAGRRSRAASLVNSGVISSSWQSAGDFANWIRHYEDLDLMLPEDED